MKQPTFHGRVLLPLSVLQRPAPVIRWQWSASCGTMTAI